MILCFVSMLYLGSGRSESQKDPSGSGSGRGPKDIEQRTIKFEYKIPNFDPQNWNYWLPLGLAVTAGYMLTRPSMNSRRISWQEFRVNYLEKGEVDRLEVVNKSLVKVYLRRDAGTGPGVSWENLLFFGGGGGGRDCGSKSAACITLAQTKLAVAVHDLNISLWCVA